MESEQKYWLCVWAIIAIGVVAIVGLATNEAIQTKRAAFEHGYEQRTEPGSDSSFWVKAQVGK